MLFSSVSPNFQEQSVSLITFCLWYGEKHLRSPWWSCEHLRAPGQHSELQCQTPLLSPNPREEYKCYESWAAWRTAPSIQGNKQLVTLKPPCLHPAVECLKLFQPKCKKREHGLCGDHILHEDLSSWLLEDDLIPRAGDCLLQVPCPCSLWQYWV